MSQTGSNRERASGKELEHILYFSIFNEVVRACYSYDGLVAFDMLSMAFQKFGISFSLLLLLVTLNT